MAVLDFMPLADETVLVEHFERPVRELEELLAEPVADGPSGEPLPVYDLRKQDVYTIGPSGAQILVPPWAGFLAAARLSGDAESLRLFTAEQPGRELRLASRGVGSLAASQLLVNPLVPEPLRTEEWIEGSRLLAFADTESIFYLIWS